MIPNLSRPVPSCINAISRVLSRDWGVGANATAMETDRRYVHAMWAFALEENGDYARAAQVARDVLQEDPTGACVLCVRACIGIEAPAPC